jgi:hypothetical protein
MTLIERIEAAGYSSEDLDELVYEAANAMASNSNNEGIRGQVNFLTLIAGWSESEILEELDMENG